MKRAVILGLMVVFAASCDDDGTAPPTLANLQPVGGTVGFSAVVDRPVPDSLTVRAIGSDGNGLGGVEVSFTVVSGGGAVSPSDVTTDAQGLARTEWTLGTAAGDNVARATADGVDAVEFQANARADTLERVLVSPETVDFFALEETTELSASGEDRFGNPVPTPNLTWRSLDPDIADVDRAGLVTARGLGSVTVVATSRGIEGAATVAVRQEPAAIELAPESAVINAIGYTHDFTVTVHDANDNLIEEPILTWESTAPDILEVDEAGRVTGLAVGEARVVVTSREVADTVDLLVRQIVASVGVTPPVATTQEGDDVEFVAEALDSAGVVIPDADFTWTVGDTMVATVGSDGMVTGRRLGETEVVARSEDVDGAAEVRVQQPPSMAAAGAHSCGVAASGQVHCWGLNSHGQLGDGSTGSSGTPVAVTGELRFRQAAAGYRHTCAIEMTGLLYCWGSAERGQLGIGSFSDRDAPAEVEGIEGVVAVSLGRDHTCALEADGSTFCWGFNAQGQLGSGSRDDSSEPVRLTSHTFEDISAGFYHTCALDASGDVYCWGENLFGQLGDGTGEDSTSPVRAAVDDPVDQVVSGAVHACALTADGEAYCWGDNLYGQLGNGESGSEAREFLPVRAAPGRTFVQLRSRGWYTCGIEVSGATFCWGDNVDGQLGSGSTAQVEPGPVAVSGGGFDFMTAGYFHSVGLRGAEPYAWGWNEYGQLGDGGSASSPEPVSVIGWAPWPEDGVAGIAGVAPAGGMAVTADAALLDDRIEERLRHREPR